MPARVRRCLALLLALAVTPGTWIRATLPPPSYDQRVTFTPIPLPPPSVLAANLAPFELVSAWRMESPHPNFAGFSALVRTGAGKFLAISDKGYALRFSAPGMDQRDTRIVPVSSKSAGVKATRDAEGATHDPQTGRTWIAWEWTNAISRLTSELQQEAIARPAAISSWGNNAGPETLVRLADGRFLLLREGLSGRNDAEHKGVIFAGDPVESDKADQFTFIGPEHFSPSDAAQLSDGRVLILMRRLVWPLPFRFAGRLALAHPDDIRPGGTWKAHEVAKLTSSLPGDNFEGIAIEPGPGSRVTVWLISDDNDAATQSTILWKLVVDPAKLH